MVDILDSQYDAWLSDDQKTKPIVLVQLEHSAGTVYLSDRAYVSYHTDTDPNRFYEELLTERIRVKESLNSGSVGSIVVLDDGSHDDWLGLKWRGYSIRIYVGDARWRFSNFRLVADLKNAGISAPGTDRYRFDILDASLVLEELIGADLAPLSIASPNNVPAVLIDFANLTYKVHAGAIFTVSVRDQGVALSGGSAPTIDFHNGEFDLVSAPAGQITVDVTRAGSTARNSIFDLVEFMSVQGSTQHLDIDDALLPDPDNKTTTLMTATNNAVITTPVVDTFNVVNVESNTTPTDGASGEIDISSLATGGLTAGDTFVLSGEARHVGTGGRWYLELLNNAKSPISLFLSFDSTDTDWEPFKVAMIYDTGVNDAVYFAMVEGNGFFDGGLQVRNLQAHTTSLQLDSASINDADIASDPIGIYVDAPESVGSLLTKITQSLGAFFRFNSLGKLVVKKLKLPGTAVLNLTKDDIDERGLTHIETEDPIGNMIMRYDRNWKPQSADGQAGSVPADDREAYSREWREVNKTNTLTGYPLLNNQVKESYFFDDIGAQAEVDRQQVIRSTKRDRFKAKSTMASVQVEIGDTINVAYPQYGLDAGKDFVLVDKEYEYGKKNIALMVWG